MKEQLAEEKNIPQYLRSHWQKETGFAFPSGHTMFAASWALLVLLVCCAASANVNHCYLVGLGNGSHGKPPAARDALPRDLVVATLISWALVAVATWLAQRIVGH